MRGVKIGLPFDEGVQMGPFVSGAQRERVMGFVERAKAAGAKMLTGGGVPKRFSKQGYFFEPTVIVDADQKAEIIQSEVFGPVLTVTTSRMRPRRCATGQRRAVWTGGSALDAGHRPGDAAFG